MQKVGSRKAPLALHILRYAKKRDPTSSATMPIPPFACALHDEAIRYGSFGYNTMGPRSASVDERVTRFTTGEVFSLASNAGGQMGSRGMDQRSSG